MPQNGTLTTDGLFLYTPNANFFGTDTFRYLASDGEFSSMPATVTINVNAVNDVPVAVADSLTIESGGLLEVSTAQLLFNDTDSDNDVLSLEVASQPANGTLNVDGETITYSPSEGFTGPDSFTYRVSDGTATSEPVTVTIEVTGSSALSATLIAARDATLFESEVGTVANGQGNHFFVGQNGAGNVRRGLLWFDVSAAIFQPERLLPTRVST